jgi:hypothetical protein
MGLEYGLKSLGKACEILVDVHDEKDECLLTILNSAEQKEKAKVADAEKPDEKPTKKEKRSFRQWVASTF